MLDLSTEKRRICGMPGERHYSTRRLRQDALYFGPTATLFSVQSLARQMDVETLSVSSLLRALNVPIIYLGDRVYYNRVALEDAMAMVSRLGGPGFFGPGSRVLERFSYNKRFPNRKTAIRGTRRLTREYVEANLDRLVAWKRQVTEAAYYARMAGDSDLVVRPPSGASPPIPASQAEGLVALAAAATGEAASESAEGIEEDIGEDAGAEAEEAGEGAEEEAGLPSLPK